MNGATLTESEQDFVARILNKQVPSVVNTGTTFSLGLDNAGSDIGNAIFGVGQWITKIAIIAAIIFGLYVVVQAMKTARGN